MPTFRNYAVYSTRSWNVLWKHYVHLFENGIFIGWCKAMNNCDAHKHGRAWEKGEIEKLYIETKVVPVRLRKTHDFHN